MSQFQEPQTEPPAAALAGVPLPAKQGGYSLKEILQLHDQALTDEAAPTPAAGLVAPPAAFDVGPSTPVATVPAVADPTIVAPQPAAPAASRPWGAMPMASAAPGVQPAAPVGKAKGLPVIDPKLFAAMPVDTIEAAAADSEPAATVQVGSDNPMARLQRSLATLNELESQLDQLMNEASASTAPDSQEWLGALATARTEPEAAPADVLTETPVKLPFIRHDDGQAAPQEAAVEPLEPAEAFPFPGMQTYRGDEPETTGEDAAPAASALEPPFYVTLPGGSVDLAEPAGITACQTEIHDALAEVGEMLGGLLQQQQAQGRLNELMARVHAGPLSVDEVIETGKALAEARARASELGVDRRRISDLVARLEQDRALFSRCIDLLWRL